MKKSPWLIWPAFLIGGCLMTRLEVGGPDEANGGEGGDASNETDVRGGSPNTSGGSLTTQGGDGDRPGDGGDTNSAGRAGSASGGAGANGGSNDGGSQALGGAGNSSEGGEGGTLMTNGGKAGMGGVGGNGGSMTGGNGGSVTGGNGGSAGAGEPSILDVRKSSGCNKSYNGASGTTAITLDTSGQKDAVCADAYLGSPTCGLWGQAGSAWRTTPVPRDYYVNLPTGYDKTKAYPLIIQGPGCGGNGQQVYPLADLSASVIRVGWTPPPNYVGHGTNPGQLCFDEKEGDDSVEWVFYEKMYDKLESELCFDRNRVFVSGNSSGAWVANEMGCKYSGNATRPVRGVLANTGGLPTDPKFVPTCTQAPMAGMWVHETGDTTNPFTGSKVAIDRALKVNKCATKSYDTSTFENYPIGGGKPDTTCKKVVGCPDDYPVVVCALPGNGHGTHDDTTNPGFATFVTSLMAK